MTGYLALYTTEWARLMRRAHDGRHIFRLSRFGLLPHEIAALNAR